MYPRRSACVYIFSFFAKYLGSSIIVYVKSWWLCTKVSVAGDQLQNKYSLQYIHLKKSTFHFKDKQTIVVIETDLFLCLF